MSGKKDSKGNAIVEKEWEDGDTEKKTNNKMWQIIDCRQEVTPDGVRAYYAKIREFKGRPELLGKEYKTLNINATTGEYAFYGLPVLRDKENVEEVDYDADLF